MKTLLKFARLDKRNRVVLVELWGEDDGTPRNLRKTTLNPTDNLDRFRQDFMCDDIKSFVEAIKEEILVLEKSYGCMIGKFKKIVRDFEQTQRKPEEQFEGRLAELVKMLNCNNN